MTEQVCAQCGRKYIDRSGFDLCNDCMRDAVEELKATLESTERVCSHCKKPIDRRQVFDLCDGCKRDAVEEIENIRKKGAKE